MEEYFTVFQKVQAEHSEKHSRFIATIKHCETEAEAVAFLEEIRSEYWDAKHNCFAYSLRKNQISRFSDDGEPHGTAGKPMLDVITGAGITDVAVVVTRYFGGVLLGTGGLVRAYSKAVRDCILKSEILKMLPSVSVTVTCEYADYDKLVNLIDLFDGITENSDFTENVTVNFCLKEKLLPEFAKKLTETFGARLFLKENVKKMMPFKEK